MSSGNYTRDTIAAIATAPGRGGIGIVRVSGPLVADISRSLTGSLPEPRYASLADFKNAHGEVIDQGIVLHFRAPLSFTGEDVLELQGHGGPVVLDMLLSAVVDSGARVAEPGEFSKRAYLNDKLDLAQAEAIADLVNSSTQQAARGAMRSLEGEFSRKVADLTAAVIELRVYVEAAIDFPEEEIDFLAGEKVTARIMDIHQRLQATLAETSTGALLSEGADVVLLGKPNAGKSSLMNRLTGRDTSIVTRVPGTTRDIVDERLQLDGIPLRLVDTAGLRESEDEIETEGVRRAMAAVEKADLVIAVIDASQPDAQSALQELEAAAGSGMIIVHNKIDLIDDGQKNLPEGALGISAKSGEGMQELKQALKTVLGVQTPVESGYTARTRHIVALTAALDAVERGKSELAVNAAGELLAEELRICQDRLSEITGEFTADDLLGEIFSRFCLGK